MMNEMVAMGPESVRRGAYSDWRNRSARLAVGAPMLNGKEKNWFETLGCRVSEAASNISAHPFAQIGIILFCGLWWLIGLPTDILTAALSILAITLTQMVLNRQNARELDAHRRDVAMHAKLDELVIANRRARNEVAGIEDELEEDEIEDLKRHAVEAVEDATDEDATSAEKAEAHRRAAEAHAKLAKAGKAPGKAS